jgi:hypothetical protein
MGTWCQLDAFIHLRVVTTIKEMRKLTVPDAWIECFTKEAFAREYPGKDAKALGYELMEIELAQDEKQDVYKIAMGRPGVWKLSEVMEVRIFHETIIDNGEDSFQKNQQRSTYEMLVQNELTKIVQGRKAIKDDSCLLVAAPPSASGGSGVNPSMTPRKSALGGQEDEDGSEDLRSRPTPLLATPTPPRRTQLNIARHLCIML